MEILIICAQHFRSFIDRTNNIFFRRKKQNDIKDVLYHNMMTVIKGEGVVGGSMALEENTGNSTTTSAIEKASNKLPIDCLQNLTTSILMVFPIRNGRILAVDGSVLRITRFLKSHLPFLASLTGSFKMGFLLAIYDIEDRVPIAYRLDPSCDERAALISLSSHIRPGDTLIVDQNYYSSDLFRFFQAKGVYLLCRLSCTNHHIYQLEGGADIDYEYDGVEARRITWEHPTKQGDGKTMVFASNLDREQFPLKKIVTLYHSRWDIEEFFKNFKHRLGGEFYRHKSLETIHRKISSQMLTAIMNGIAVKSSTDLRIARDSKRAHNSKWERKISFGYTLKLLSQFLLLIIYQPEDFEQRLLSLLNIAVKKATIPIRDDRSNPRKTITPPSEFYGNKKSKKSKKSKESKKSSKDDEQLAPKKGTPVSKKRRVKQLKTLQMIYHEAREKRPFLVNGVKKICFLFLKTFEKMKIFLLRSDNQPAPLAPLVPSISLKASYNNKVNSSY